MAEQLTTCYKLLGELHLKLFDDLARDDMVGHSSTLAQIMALEESIRELQAFEDEEQE